MAFPAAPGDTTDRQPRLSDLARAVLTEAAPRELALLDDVTDAWHRGEPTGVLTGRDRWHGGTIGLGLTSPALVDLVYPLLTGTIAQILGTVAASRLGRRRWGRRQRPDAAVPAELLAQPERARELCLGLAVDAGVSKRKAELIAAALYAALVRETDPPR